MKKLVASLLVSALLIFAAGLVYFSFDTSRDVEVSVEADDGMPNVFHGFYNTWNSQTALWLAREKNMAEEELKDWRSSASPGKEASIAMREQELEILKERIGMGPVIREKTGDSLPKGLVWQNGQNEPDIGDGRAVKGGKIRLFSSLPFPSTVREFGPGSLNYFNHSLYDSVSIGLVKLHPETGKVIPGVAREWAVTNGGKTVFFRLDPRARYSNGQKVKVRDFLLGMCLRVSEFAKDPYWVTRYRETIASIEMYGDDVISVTLARPVPLIPYMASRDLHAANPTFYKRFDSSFPLVFQWAAAPTTGGYTIIPGDVRFGRSITMSRVKNWWAKDLKFYRNTCNADRIEYRFISDESIALELFHQGEIEAVRVEKPDVWAGKVESAEFLNGYVERVTFESEYPCPTYGISLNTASSLLADVEMRRGILHALDMDGAVRSVFRGNHSRLRSYSDGYGELTRPFDVLPYSPQLARECFARCGFDRVGSDGILIDKSGKRLSVALTYASFSPAMRSLCDLLRQSALACGLDLRLDGLESSVCSRKVLEKRHDMALWAEPGASPFPELFRVFHSSLARDDKGRLVTQTNNICSVSDETLDSLLMEERWAGDMAALKRALHAVQKRLDELCIWCPGWKENNIKIASWGWVRWPDSPQTNFSPHLVDDPFEAHLYWIDEDRRREINNARKAEQSFPIVDKRILIRRSSENVEKNAPDGF